jgi:TPR repeat protein
VELFTEACKGKEPLGCSNLAFCYQTGDGVAKDLAQAYAYYIEACDLGRFDDCNDAAVIIGKTKGVPTDPELKRQLYQKACEGKVQLACENLAVLTEKR